MVVDEPAELEGLLEELDGDVVRFEVAGDGLEEEEGDDLLGVETQHV